MSGKFKDLGSLFSLEIFNSLLNSKIITIAQLNAALPIIINNCIPFTFNFSPGNKAFAPAVQLTINLSPTTTVSFVLPFEPGPTEFDNL